MTTNNADEARASSAATRKASRAPSEKSTGHKIFVNPMLLLEACDMPLEACDMPLR
jgi:hypothetical protein